VSVTSGEHKGETGRLIGSFIAKGIGVVDDEDIGHRWFIQLDQGKQDILKESELEILPTE
jgi:hypothetical protein